MSAVLIPFETPAQKEDRLYREVMAAFDDFSVAQPQASLGGILQALDRLVACQGAARARAAGRRPGAQARQHRPD